MILHGEASGPFLLAWHIEPYLVFLFGTVAGVYLLGLRRIARRGNRIVPANYPVSFYGGLLALLIAIAGPVEAYNDRSFALHMAQHVLMMLVAAPLLVLGRPVHIALWALRPEQSGAVLRPLLRQGLVSKLLRVVTHPLTVLLVINVNLVIWHLPIFYVAALENWLVHELEHMLFIGTAALFWWVLVDPIPRHHRGRPDIALLLLFLTGSVGNLLSLYLIFAPDVIYPYYLESQTVFGLTQHADQRLGGLVMMVAGTLVYFGATFWLIVRSFSGAAPIPDEPSQSESRQPLEPSAGSQHPASSRM